MTPPGTALTTLPAIRQRLRCHRGRRPARTLKDELLALEARQDSLRAELAAAPETCQPRLYPNLAEVYRRKVVALHEALANETTRDEAFELIRSLIEEVVVTPTGEELKIDLYGELADILSLCREGRRNADAPTRVRDLQAQRKVVAGPATTDTSSCCLWQSDGHRRSAKTPERPQLRGPSKGSKRRRIGLRSLSDNSGRLVIHILGSVPAASLADCPAVFTNVLGQ